MALHVFERQVARKVLISLLLTGQICLAAAQSGDLPDALATQMLTAVNAARATARSCGEAAMPPVVPLTWNATLAQSAARHSTDQAARKTMTHRGADGSSVAERVARSGYEWRAVGENVYSASWQASAAEAFKAWLASPGHCRNLMSANFTSVGAGFADAGQQRFWTQVFAAPR